MSDKKGDPTKQPPECVEHLSKTHCPYIECVGERMDGETWECRRCGEYFHLYYEDIA